MKSHNYACTLQDLAPLLAGPLLVVALFAGVMFSGARLHLLPPPRPTLDTDRTILIHQAETAQTSSDARVLLIGDSSCLMDVNTRQLGQQLGVPALNLGTLSFLDLNNYAELLRRFTNGNRGQLRAVVLLMNPEALRRVSAEDYFVGVLTAFWGEQDFCRTATLDDKLACALGLETFRGRVLARTLPVPLGGAFGRFYGFDSNLEKFMTREHGSVIDPVVEQPKGRPEFRLSPTLKPASEAFRLAVPAGSKLLVGITPVPREIVGTDYARSRDEMLRQWGAWLQADALLDSLPATLPEDQFARSTHLNQYAVPRYTEELGVRIVPYLR